MKKNVEEFKRTEQEKVALAKGTVQRKIQYVNKVLELKKQLCSD